jgi:hypothetical protein
VDGVVAGKGSNWAAESNVLGRSSDLELLGSRRARAAVGSDVQAASLVVDTVGASAGGDGVVESILVLPALEVVCVETVAGSITVGVDKAVVVLD